jgi:hypothetical protein
MNANRFYVYLFLREDGTPYYVGKGCGGRQFDKRRTVKLPSDRSRNIRVLDGMTEEDALAWEMLLIARYGRKNIGTGILRNGTDGGEGTSNPSKELRDLRGATWRGKNQSKAHIERRVEARRKNGKSLHSNETRQKMSVAHSGKTLSAKHKANIGKASKRCQSERGAKELGISVEAFDRLTKKQRFSMRTFLKKFPFVSGVEYLAMDRGQRTSLSARFRGVAIVQGT